eukprot:TRINITY_DN56443_c0_g1_i1.p1 TRINITY_DN56443_c0_g1~~TRINITY_DN56443_c0_g1_i1.p1  ORF type:complete len:369 (-),score=72.90 TRINITY_DN56443_c0_g1_i1:8-1114(-)
MLRSLVGSEMCIRDRPRHSSSPGPYQQQVSFPMKADGTTLRGTLLLPGPGSTGALPAVIMAHGFSATYRMGIKEYGEVFRQMGCAVLLYDHASYGSSDGIPRCHLDWFSQAGGYLDAFEWLSQHEAVDPARIAIWGISFSGGVVLTVAAVEPRIAAVISLCPGSLTDKVGDAPDHARFEQLKRLILEREYMAAKTKLIGPMPVVHPTEPDKGWFYGGVKSIAAQCEDNNHANKQTREVFLLGGASDELWVNETTMVVRKTAVKQGSDLSVHHIFQPALLMAAPDDEVMPYPPMVKAFTAIPAPGKQYYVLDGGHYQIMKPNFSPLRTPEFHDAAGVQGDFLRKALGLSPAAVKMDDALKAIPHRPFAQ